MSLGGKNDSTKQSLLAESETLSTVEMNPIYLKSPKKVEHNSSFTNDEERGEWHQFCFITYSQIDTTGNFIDICLFKNVA